MTKSNGEQRESNMLAMRKDGKTLQEIGGFFGVSYQRVAQIIGETYRAQGRETRRRRRVDAITTLRLDGMTASEISEKLGISTGAVYSDAPGVRFKTYASGSLGTGSAWEEWVSARLLDAGIENELMSHKHPYDILALGSVRIDVKSSNYLANSLPSQVYTSDTYVFNIANTQKKRDGIDIVIFVIIPHEIAIIVPLSILPKNTTHIRIPYPCVGKKKSKYHYYISAWRFIKLMQDYKCSKGE